jgi:hypothetical protein
MDSQEFTKEMESRVRKFCGSMHGQLPAYRYTSLAGDALGIETMKNRLRNEIRADEFFGLWLATTPGQVDR